jgi:hypothetical protein
MQIQPKTIETRSAATQVIDHLNAQHPFSDDPVNKLLTVSVNFESPGGGAPARPQITVQFAGADYDAFYAQYTDGWTGTNLNAAIIAKLGLTVVP